MQTTLLPTPFELKKQFPLTSHAQQEIKRFQEHAKSHLKKPIPNQIYAIVGPCSLHNVEETHEYADKLSALSKELKSIKVVMRAYIEKPRTQAGFKGLLYQPDPTKQENIKEGLILCRKLLRDLAEKLPIAIEIVDPYLTAYFEDLLSWAFIGARTSSSQIHRQIASKLDFPVGFKNTLDGNIQIAIDAMRFSRREQHFFHLSSSGRMTRKHSYGNEHTHLVLRGSATQTNYDEHSLNEAYRAQMEIKNPILIDCSHGNSHKNIDKQAAAFLEIIEYRTQKTPLLGVMLESYLKSGNQKESCDPYKAGVSITDPCMDFETTANLLKYADRSLQKQTVSL